MSEPLMNMPIFPAANAWLIVGQRVVEREPIELSVQRICLSMLQRLSGVRVVSVAVALVPRPVSIRPPSV